MVSRPILIVDDEDMVRETLGEALESGGYRVESAASATEALARMAEEDFAVVLTDMNMPGGPSGLDLLSEIKARDPAVVVVIITAFGTLDTAISALKRGAFDFIQKPFKIREIEMILDRALDHARVLRELEEYHAELEARVLARTEELRALHESVLRLNELTLEAAASCDPEGVAEPFAGFLAERYRPDALAILVPSGTSWRVLAARPEGKVALADLPAPGHPAALLESPDGAFRETRFLPLGQEEAVGALVLRFRGRSALHPEDPALAMCCRQLGALLKAREKVSGLRRKGGR